MFVAYLLFFFSVCLAHIICQVPLGLLVFFVLLCGILYTVWITDSLLAKCNANVFSQSVVRPCIL